MKHLNASCKNGFLTHNTIGGTSQTFDIDDENFSPVDIAKVMDALTAMTRTLWPRPQDPSFPAGDGRGQFIIAVDFEPLCEGARTLAVGQRFEVIYKDGDRSVPLTQNYIHELATGVVLTTVVHPNAEASVLALATDFEQIVALAWHTAWIRMSMAATA